MKKGWSSLPVQRPVAVLMAMAAALVFGLVSYAKLPLALFPTLSYPTLTLRSTYPGAAPEEVEESVIRPIEDLVSTTDGLMRMRSVSRADGGDVVLEFAWDRSMSSAAQDLRERMDLLQLPEGVRRPLLLRYDPSLDPIVRLGLYAEPGGLSLAELREEAEEHLRPILERLPGVAALRVEGGEEREVEVALDHRRMAVLGLSPAIVAARLSAENINIAGGELRDGDTQYLVRTLHELRDLDAIRDLVMARRNGQSIRLGDLATVRLHSKRPQRLVRFLGQRGVELSVFREADANIVATAARLRKALQLDGVGQAKTGAAPGRKSRARSAKSAKLGQSKKPDKSKKSDQADKQALAEIQRPQAPLLPAGVHAVVLEDQSQFIQAAIGEVKSAALLGGLLAMLVLYVFLRRIRTTLIAALAIPVSIAITFAPLYLGDVSLNIMSLGGLALGVGMLVDNAVVVLESITRCQEEGDALEQAAARGLREIGGAVFASTLTTVAVFAPMVFVEGIAGQIFGDLALSVVVSLLASLLVAMSLIPMLASRQLAAVDDGGQPVSIKMLLRLYLQKIRRGLRPEGTRWWRWLLYPWRLALTLLFALLGLPGLLFYSVYDLGLALLLKIPVWLQGLGHLGSGSVGAGAGLGARFDALYLRAEQALLRLLRGGLQHPTRVLLPSVLLLLGALVLVPGLGSNLAPDLHQGHLDLRVALPPGTPLERTAAMLKNVETTLAQDPTVALLSSFIGSSSEQWRQSSEGEHSARIFVRLKAGSDMAARELALGQKARELVAKLPGAQLRVQRPSLFTQTAPVEVQIFGNNIELLQKSARQVYALMQQDPSLRDIETSALDGFPELRVQLQQASLSHMGLTADQVARSLRDWLQGREASVYRPRQGRGERFDIVVRSDLGALPGLSEIGQLSVGQYAGQAIPLNAVATLRRHLGPVDVRHVDGLRAVMLRASLRKGAHLEQSSQALQRKLDQLALPVGVRAVLAGQDIERQQAMSSLRFAMLLALFLVFAILAAQFESLLIPVLVMATVPLGLVGAVYGLVLTRTPMSILALIGGITLIGIVVNNAIVLIDRVRQELQQGQALELALQNAVRVRLRPILMTTLTTVIALLPMAFSSGEGAEIRAPIAVTLVFGLSLSTALTLILIPVLLQFVWRGKSFALDVVDDDE